MTIKEHKDLPELFQELGELRVRVAHIEEALEKNIAKECARNLLPLNTETTLYMNGTIRSWIHYIETRTDTGTQFEHRETANSCKNIFIKEMPIIAKALGWSI